MTLQEKAREWLQRIENLTIGGEPELAMLSGVLADFAAEQNRELRDYADAQTEAFRHSSDDAMAAEGRIEAVENALDWLASAIQQERDHADPSAFSRVGGALVVARAVLKDAATGGRIRELEKCGFAMSAEIEQLLERIRVLEAELEKRK